MGVEARPLPSNPPPCFRAYDVRGRVPEEIDAALAYRIGRGFAQFSGARRVVLGRDVRPSGEELSRALAEGLGGEGVQVFDLGLCGSEELYFATCQQDMDGGIMVTASHNPAEYNGFKLVGRAAAPISLGSGLEELWAAARSTRRQSMPVRRGAQSLDTRPAYIAHLLSCLGDFPLSPLSIVLNPGNGGAGPVVDALGAQLPFELHRYHHEPDGTFPHGVPNPMLEEQRDIVIQGVRTHQADLGIAWDGDFDRCFLFDETGRYSEGYYVVGLLAEWFLHSQPGERVVYDPRLYWNTRDLLQRHGGEGVRSRAGHSFMKQAMRRAQAVYGGESSGHHYFRDFFYCDSGMLPWLLTTALLARYEQPLSALLEEYRRAYPVSGEINLFSSDPKGLIEHLHTHYANEALHEDRFDGLSMEFPKWRFNVRRSNTESLLRLNVESCGDEELLNKETRALTARMKAFNRGAD